MMMTIIKHNTKRTKKKSLSQFSKSEIELEKQKREFSSGWWCKNEKWGQEGLERTKMGGFEIPWGRDTHITSEEDGCLNWHQAIFYYNMNIWNQDDSHCEGWRHTSFYIQKDLQKDQRRENEIRFAFWSCCSSSSFSWSSSFTVKLSVIPSPPVPFLQHQRHPVSFWWLLRVFFILLFPSSYFCVSFSDFQGSGISTKSNLSLSECFNMCISGVTIYTDSCLLPDCHSLLKGWDVVNPRTLFRKKSKTAKVQFLLLVFLQLMQKSQKGKGGRERENAFPASVWWCINTLLMLVLLCCFRMLLYVPPL